MSSAKEHKLDTNYICVGLLKHIDWRHYQLDPDQAVECKVLSEACQSALIFSIAETHRLTSAFENGNG